MLAGGATLAGYPAPPALLDGLRAAVPAPVTPLRTLRLATDAGAADRKIEGSALWRRSEPANAPDLAAHLADDIAEWAAQCAGC
jgi:hypothetical protein